MKFVYYFDPFKSERYESGTILFNKRYPSAQGSLTDFNVWKRELQEREMKDFTTCKEPQMSGDLIPLNITDWAFTERIQPSEYEELSKIQLNTFKIEIFSLIW